MLVGLGGGDGDGPDDTVPGVAPIAGPGPPAVVVDVGQTPECPIGTV
jgi:hypothetical protein